LKHIKEVLIKLIIHMRTSIFKNKLYSFLGLLLISQGVFFFRPSKKQEKPQEYIKVEIIRSENGETIRQDTAFSTASGYSIDQYLKEQNLKSENLHILSLDNQLRVDSLCKIMPAKRKGKFTFIEIDHDTVPQAVVLPGKHEQNVRPKKYKLHTIEKKFSDKDGKPHTFIKIEDKIIADTAAWAIKRKDEFIKEQQGQQKIEIRIEKKTDENGETDVRHWVNGDEVEPNDVDSLPRFKLLINPSSDKAFFEFSGAAFSIDTAFQLDGLKTDNFKKMKFILHDKQNNLQADEQTAEAMFFSPKVNTSGNKVVIICSQLSQEEFEQWEHKRKAETGSSLNLKNFKLYPNPSQGRFKISLELSEPKPARLIITKGSGNGTTIMEEEIKDPSHPFEKEFDLSGQERGLYILTIQQGQKYESKKVWIQ
jgi:hypothetical protein